jgi:hypothetical protein
MAFPFVRRRKSHSRDLVATFYMKWLARQHYVVVGRETPMVRELVER